MGEMCVDGGGTNASIKTELSDVDNTDSGSETQVKMPMGA